MASDEQEPEPWEGRLVRVAGQFGTECAELRDTNPYAATEYQTPLENVINYMATELWDQNFSVTEIKLALKEQ